VVIRWLITKKCATLSSSFAVVSLSPVLGVVGIDFGGVHDESTLHF
jgi:hypothetical protein